MSRWVEQFETHAFQNTWTNLKASLDESSVDDETVLTSVKELERLRKVISYLDEMIHSLDPELVPVATWDSFNAQATACQQQIDNYNANRNIAHLTNANANADNLLTYVRPYMIVEGEAGKVLQKSVKVYAKTIDKYGESFVEKSGRLVKEVENLKNIAEESSDIIKNVKTSIEEFESYLFGTNDVTGIQSKVRELVDDFDSKYENINTLYNETLIGDEENPSTKSEIHQAKESILLERTKIEELLDDVSNEIKNIESFHKKIFGDSSGDDEVSESLSKDLEDLMQALKDFKIEQSTKYNALNEQIEELLPGATSAGLATAYKEMKISFNEPIKHASRVFYWSLGLLVFASFLLAINSVGGESWITFVKFKDWDMVLKGLLYKVPFYAPVLWLAFYATKRRSEYQRLQQEYAHKEALAKSYNSYKKQIEDLGGNDKDMQKEFIMKAIDAISFNASSTLDGKHGDKMFAHEVFEAAVEAAVKLQK